MARRDARGFTMLELLIALAIVSALLAVAFGGLRVGLAAWQQGETRADSHQHVRGLTLTLAHAVEGTYPFQGTRSEAPESVLLFEGGEKRLAFVTQTPPFPFQIPIAFAAVVVSLDGGDEPGLVVRQRALPNFNPFSDAAVVLRDPSVTELAFRYMDDSGTWKPTWDVDAEKTLPRAVQITVTAQLGGRTDTLPAMTVPVRVTPP